MWSDVHGGDWQLACFRIRFPHVRFVEWMQKHNCFAAITCVACATLRQLCVVLFHYTIAKYMLNIEFIDSIVLNIIAFRLRWGNACHFATFWAKQIDEKNQIYSNQFINKWMFWIWNFNFGAVIYRSFDSTRIALCGSFGIVNEKHEPSRRRLCTQRQWRNECVAFLFTPM